MVRMPRKAVGASCLEVPKTMAGALGSLSWWEAALPMAKGGAEWALNSLQT